GAVSGEVHSTTAGLCCGEPSLVAWRTLEQTADFFVTVPDDVVSDCMRLLALSQFGDRPIVAGESAIAGLAGFLCTASDPDARTLLQLTPDSRVLLFGTESDTDPFIYQQIVGLTSHTIRRPDSADPGTRR